MIIPSIDIMNGRAVQLRRGRELVLDGGDPLERLEQFSVVGEVAVVDLDAAMGRGSNTSLVREMVKRADCRVGGGIRDLDSARAWLDAGAAKIMIGTAATPEFCSQLPRDRIIAALDSVNAELVVDGWREKTGVDVMTRAAELVPHVGGVLLTQVEHEGTLEGFNSDVVTGFTQSFPDVCVTAAGGITTAAQIRELDELGADAQVGMALYSGVLSLPEAYAAVLAKPVDGDIWPTVVCDENGMSLGLAWSNRESLGLAIEQGKGIYWSRSRQEIWLKGATSGNTQELLSVKCDCDRDALRFTVRQKNSFCHRGNRSCWNLAFELGDLERTIADRLANPEAGSRTSALAVDPELLQAKLNEEAVELGRARTVDEVVHETADLLYFALVALQQRGGSLARVVAELARRDRSMTRRVMRAKTPELRQ